MIGAALPAAVLLLPTAAHAQAPSPAPAPAPAPVETTLKLTTEKARSGEAFKGDKWRALVVADRFVAGTKVDLSFTAKGRSTKKRITLKQQKDGEKGYVRVVLPAKFKRSNRVVVRASVPDGQPTAAVAAKSKVVLQATPSVKAGDRGLAVRMLQEMLDAKGYVIGKKGVYDARTQRAVLAFRKVTRRAKNTSADSTVFRALRRGEGTFRVRFPKHGRHMEGDVDRQVIALIDGDKVERIYHSSPGAPATPTIRGSFRVYRKDPGTNSLGMYRSVYFIRGYAVHGYKSVPTFNASHGCFRVPMADAASIYDWMTMGMRVDTY